MRYAWAALYSVCCCIVTGKSVVILWTSGAPLEAIAIGFMVFFYAVNYVANTILLVSGRKGQ